MENKTKIIKTVIYWILVVLYFVSLITSCVSFLKWTGIIPTNHTAECEHQYKALQLLHFNSINKTKYG